LKELAVGASVSHEPRQRLIGIQQSEALMCQQGRDVDTG
jgi:hypothetical protein